MSDENPTDPPPDRRDDDRDTGDDARTRSVPRLAVWKFASCDGCQLTLLDCNDELLTIAEQFEIVHFPEVTSTADDGLDVDISLVEGSISTDADLARIHDIRRRSALLVTLGACATAGGIQALRNGRDIDEFTSIVYARPDYVDTLATSTPIADHVDVDLELHGCPIDRNQMVRTLAELLDGRLPRLPATSVCTECRATGNTCVLVAHGTACLGPITRAGCAALCPSFRRGCFGCFGPMESPNVDALRDRLVAGGDSDDAVDRLVSTFAAAGSRPGPAGPRPGRSR